MPAPKFEVILRHQPLTLRGDGLGQVPEQELLSHGGGGKPDARAPLRDRVRQTRDEAAPPGPL